MRACSYSMAEAGDSYWDLMQFMQEDMHYAGLQYTYAGNVSTEYSRCAYM